MATDSIQTKTTTPAARADSSALTTISLSPSVRKRAKEQADALKVPLKEFAEGALLYFIRYRLHPGQMEAREDVPKEVHKLRNQVFSFLQKQESLHLLPVVKAVYALQGEVEKLHQQQEAIYLLLFKIKTIQDISLSTLYQLSGEDEETLTGIINQNKQRFLAELEQFRQKLKTPEETGSRP